MIGTGAGALPIMDEVKREAKRRKIKLSILPTAESIETLKDNAEDFRRVEPGRNGEILGVSQETAKRDWKMARAWLYTELAGKQKPTKS